MQNIKSKFDPDDIDYILDSELEYAKIIKPFDEWVRIRHYKDWFLEHDVITYKAVPIARTAYIVGYQEGLKAGQKLMQLQFAHGLVSKIFN